MSYILNFDYKGGEQSVSFNVNSSMLPLRFEFDTNIKWIDARINFNLVTISVNPTYDYKDRHAVVSVFNANDKKIDISIEQKGFCGIDLQCDDKLVLNHGYFDLNEYYNFYVTVYGGETQDLLCKQLQSKITKVWDNGDMYNDFIIKITKGTNGKYTLKHSEYKRYKDYCKNNNLPFDESKVKKDIEIIQITEADTIGNMVIRYNDTDYTTHSVIPVVISKDNPVMLQITSTEYIHQISYTKYEIIDKKQVDVNPSPSWLSVKVDGSNINIVATERNNFETRNYTLKLTNTTNSHQFIYVNVKQESGT